MPQIMYDLGSIKACKQWDKLPTSTGDRRISERFGAILTLDPAPGVLAIQTKHAARSTGASSIGNSSAH